MKKPIKIIADHMKSMVMAAAVLIIGSGSAFAVTDATDCQSQVSTAEQMLLSANITNEQLNTIATDLDDVKQLCVDGKFSEATAKLKTNVDILKSATSN